MKKIMFMIMAIMVSVAFAEPTVKMIKDDRAGIVGNMTYYSDEEAKDKANVYLIRNHFESEKTIYNNIAKMFGQRKFYDYVEGDLSHHFDKSWETEDFATRNAQIVFNAYISPDGAILWDYLPESNFVVFELARYDRGTEEPFEYYEIVIINKNYVFLSVKNVERD